VKVKVEYLLIAGLSLCILLMQTCKDDPVKEAEERILVDRVTDTLVETRVDSFFYERFYPGVPVHIHDTVYVGDDSTRLMEKYEYNVKDSVLDATITAFAECRPKIDFSYKVLQVNTERIITVKDSSVYEKTKLRRYINAGLILNGSPTRFGFSPVLGFTDKKKNTFLLGYDVINNDLSITFTKKFGFK